MAGAATYLNTNATSVLPVNWSDATGIVEDATCIIDAQGGTAQAITLDVNRSAIAGVDTFSIQATFSGSVGTQNSPLMMGCKTKFTNSASGGVLNYQAANIAGAGAAPTTANLCSLFVQAGSGTANILGGTFTEIQQASGTVNVNQSTVVTTVNHSGGTATYESNGTPITTLTIAGGMVILKRGVTTIVNHGGWIIYDNLIACTTFTGGPNSNTDWRGGAITTANILGGFTVQNLTRATTFTNTRVWASASFNMNPQAGVVLTFTNPITYIAGGPRTSASVPGTGS